MKLTRVITGIALISLGTALSGCIGLSIGGTTEVKSPESTTVVNGKGIPTAKSYDLSDQAASAFLNDPAVIKAYADADFFSKDSPPFNSAIRTMDRKAALYKAQFPQTTPIPAK